MRVITHFDLPCRDDAITLEKLPQRYGIPHLQDLGCEKHPVPAKPYKFPHMISLLEYILSIKLGRNCTSYEFQNEFLLIYFGLTLYLKSFLSTILPEFISTA